MISEIVNLFPAELIEQGRTTGKVISGKFVLIRSPHAEWLVIGPLTIYSYHADLVRKFCETQLIHSYWSDGRERVEIEDPDFSVRGGGAVMIDAAKGKVVFGGSSKAYGPYEPKLLNRLLESDLHLGNIRIVVE